MIRTLCVFTLGLSLGIGAVAVQADVEPTPSAGPILTNMLREELETAEDLEVIVSSVEIPPRTALPRHYHPGEEFGYVVEGSVILWQEGKEDVTLHAGEAVKIPLGQVHTAMTGEEPVKLLVFRVHRKGQPERIPVE